MPALRHSHERSAHEDDPPCVTIACLKQSARCVNGAFVDSDAACTALRVAVNGRSDSAHRQPDGVTLTDLTNTLRRQHHLVGQTVYECPAWNDRFLGERRCDQCSLMYRKVGLGGRCSGCDAILTVIDLIGSELQGGDAII
jgi:hypothetical protein